MSAKSYFKLFILTMHCLSPNIFNTTNYIMNMYFILPKNVSIRHRFIYKGVYYIKENVKVTTQTTNYVLMLSLIETHDSYRLRRSYKNSHSSLHAIHTHARMYTHICIYIYIYIPVVPNLWASIPWMGLQVLFQLSCRFISRTPTIYITSHKFLLILSSYHLLLFFDARKLKTFKAVLRNNVLCYCVRFQLTASSITGINVGGSLKLAS
jgi:hypothetical protein